MGKNCHIFPIYKGISHEESSIRKQAVYMIKLTLDMYDKYAGSHVSVPLVRSNSIEKKTVLDLWSDYLLLVECLNEKQVQ